MSQIATCTAVHDNASVPLPGNPLGHAQGLFARALSQTLLWYSLHQSQQGWCGQTGGAYTGSLPAVLLSESQGLSGIAPASLTSALSDHRADS